MLNLAYITSRKNCCFEWFNDSLRNELQGNVSGVRVIVVDYWSQEIPHLVWNEQDVMSRKSSLRKLQSGFPELIITPPKPTPWNGKYRLTKKDFFAASNARNTAICYALDGYLAFVDDLSVLMPGWLSAVREHMSRNQIACGAFRKVKNIKVDSGKVVSFDDHPAGHDSRWNSGNDKAAVECVSNWLFGCSFGAPVERFLEVNGLYEACDSVGAEDCALGMAFGNRGHKLVYDRRMLTLESEEHHTLETPMIRLNKHRPDFKGDKSSDVLDKGHHLVRMFTPAKRFENYFGPEGLAGLRQRILRGEPFPTNVLPEHDWFDSQPLSEL